jgi:NADH:ubiquinone oxidoreductase subunit 6 (subunit J)
LLSEANCQTMNEFTLFLLIAAVSLLSAIATLTLRNLVHCALCLALSFAGLACLYLQLNAQFIGLVQVLVYIGAVAILILFSVLLTRGSESPQQSVFSKGWKLGFGVAAGVFLALAAALLRSRLLPSGVPPAPDITIRSIGDQLMETYVLPLQIVGLLLTAALIGAGIIALQQSPQK